MRMRIGTLHGVIVALGVLWGLSGAAPVWAGPANLIPELGYDPSLPADSAGGPGGLRILDVPDIYGPGKVSTVGNVWMKCTNIGALGNPFTAQSSDPSGQWPGASGIEYLFAVLMWAGAKDPTTTDPLLIRRVSHHYEWRPPTLDPKDKIYSTFDGQVNGARFVDDDSDGRIDEDPLDGYDDDGDGRIDEDYGAISQQEFTCLMDDYTQGAIDQPAAEKHAPRYLRCRQSMYVFSVPGASDFTSVEWEFENRSGHVLDSVYVGLRYDQDVGPISKDRYYSDDLPEPRVPQGPDPGINMSPDDPDNPNAPYLEKVTSTDPRYQGGLCTRDTVHVNGFTLTDDDGDNGQTPGASSILLLGHTIDPTGQKAPRRVGFCSYFYYMPGVPYVQGGVPTNDQERFEAMSSGRGVDPQTGLINAEVPDRGEVADYFGLASIGPFLNMQPGEKIKVAWALAVQEMDFTAKPDELTKRFPRVIENAVEAQKTYNGSYERRQGIPVPGPEDFGRETCFYKVPGGPDQFADCHDDSVGALRPLRERECTWFDLDCNYCTGVPGWVMKRWSASAPPPNPQTQLVGGDRQVRIEWDNRSEYTPDPVAGTFDFTGYKVWKAANWTRPVGSTGPGDDLWALLATYYYYDPRLNPLPTVVKGSAGQDSTILVPVLLNRETGERLFPSPASEADMEVWRLLSTTYTLPDPILVPCVPAAGDPAACDTAFAKKIVVTGDDIITYPSWPVVKYPVGHYRFFDRNVLNGFMYFYSVTAFDSTGSEQQIAKLEGRQAAVEADGVVPQSAFSSASNNGEPFVVPNPYRGRADWDLTPNATDPTGTHVDFFNLPQGWTRISIFTVSGDLVQEIQPTDAQVSGKPQRDPTLGEGTASLDAQASWNLVSRNGQDVVSGIYIFSVDGAGGTKRGKFVVVR